MEPVPGSAGHRLRRYTHFGSTSQFDAAELKCGALQQKQYGMVNHQDQRCHVGPRRKWDGGDLDGQCDQGRHVQQYGMRGWICRHPEHGQCECAREAVRPFVLLMCRPFLREEAGIAESAEDATVQALITKSPIQDLCTGQLLLEVTQPS